jgi:hypothetical protein
MQQFPDRSRWLEHIQSHIQNLEKDESVQCPHPQPSCGKFDSALRLQFHLQDTHGIPYNKESTKSKRPRDESEDIQALRPKRQCRGYGKEDVKIEISIKQEFSFVNNTVDTMSDSSSAISKSFSGRSTPLRTWGSPDSSSLGYGTPLSSVCGEEVISPTFSTMAVPDLDCIKIIDLTSDETVLPTANCAYWIPAAMKFTSNQADEPFSKGSLVESICPNISTKTNREQRPSSTPTEYEDATLQSDLEDGHPACHQSNRVPNQVEIFCKFSARFLEVSTNRFQWMIKDVLVSEITYLYNAKNMTTKDIQL